MRHNLFIMSLLLLVFAITPSFAADRLGVGAGIPDIKAKDQKGEEKVFGSLVGTHGITLVFVRSADWCPFCQKQLIELSQNRQKFSDTGYPLVGISYDSVEKLKKFDTKNKPGFTLLSDPGSKIIKGFGIMSDEYMKGTMAYGVPNPSVYIIGKDKIVDAILAEEGYKKRPTSEDILKVIEAQKPKPKPVALGEEFPEDPDQVPGSIEYMPEVAPVPADATLAPTTPPPAPVIETPAPANVPPATATPVTEDVVDPIPTGATPVKVAPVAPALNAPEAEKTQ